MKETIAAINPATEEIIAEYEEDSFSQIEEKIEKARKAFEKWRFESFEKRSEKTRKLGDLLLEKKESLAKTAVAEMGKPISQAIAEIEKSAWACRYFAENAENFLKSERIETEARESYATFRPLGIIYAVMPWNFPYWQVYRFAAPALMAGNGFVLKHAPNTVGCGLKIEELFKEAGFPEDLCANLIVSGKNTAKYSQAILENPNVAGLTLTGSSNAGANAASYAGKAIKKSVLELGGSDPYLILRDADLSLAAKACATGRYLNTGQSCIAAKRIIVDKAVKDEFLERFIEEAKKYVPGDPMDKNANMGPIARRDLRENLKRQVDKSVEAGAKPILGCSVPDRKGFYYETSILDGVKKGTPAFDEEIFGPVAAIIESESEEEAIRLANDSVYGLGAAVFSRDVEKAKKIGERFLEAGNVQINDFVRSDPRLPFGGVKKSGYGRELSAFGIREFTNVKTISVA